MPADPRAISPQPTYAFGPNNSQGMVNGQMPQEVSTPDPMGMGSMMSQLDAVLTPEQRQQLEMLPPDQRMGVIQRIMQMQGM
jgi:Spy/CpxP family protein refolding chaperone